MSYILIQLAFVTYSGIIQIDCFVNMSNRIGVPFLHPSHGIVVLFTYYMTKCACSTVLSMGIQVNRLF